MDLQWVLEVFYVKSGIGVFSGLTSMAIDNIILLRMPARE
jgi:hypothetical protein